MKKTLNELENVIFTFLLVIPKGKVVTYGVVAKQCGLKNPRNVGRILSQNKKPNIIPCYKVVRSNGTLALGYAFGGPVEQKRRLRADGIMFKGDSITNFKNRLFQG